MRILHLTPFCIVFSHLIGALHGALFMVTMPKKPYFDSEFTVAVSGHGVLGGGENVTLTYKGSFSNRVFHTKTLIFKQDEVQICGVVFSSAEIARTRDKSVHLRVQVKGERVSTQMSTILSFPDNTGFLFVQTDKQVYTPGQKVKYRIIALDEYQRFAKHPLKVDIKVPNSIVIDRLRFFPLEAFRPQEIELPKEAALGNWTISASYESQGGSPGRVYSHTFEVREYVLPRFTASVAVSPRIITDKTEEVNITVTSKYLSGRVTKGLVDLQLGIIEPQFRLPSMISDHYMKELERGKMHLSFNITNLLAGYTIEEYNKKRLYVKVVVTEKGTLETDELEDSSTIIVKPYHTISFEGSSRHLKPGFRFPFKGKVSDVIGDPAPRIEIFMRVAFEAGGKIIQEKSLNLTTDYNGEIQEQIPTPSQAMVMKIEFYKQREGGQKNDLIQFQNTFTLVKEYSQGKQYLQISVLRPLTEWKEGIFKLQYTKASLYSSITVLVISRGHLLYTTSVMQNAGGLSVVKIPSVLYKEVLPQMTILAYYPLNERNSDQFVIDSLRLPVIEKCKADLRLFQSFWARKTEKPKSKVTLNAQGAPYMQVGLVAVDKAVFALTDSQSHVLNRKTLFHQLLNHGHANTSPRVKSHSELSGVNRLVLRTKIQPPRTSRIHAQRLSTSRGSKGPSGHMESSKSFFDFGKGFHFVPDDMEGFPPPLPPQYSSVKEEEEKMEEPLPPLVVRKYFPESWLFENHVLTRTGRMKLDVTLPDSITTWSFLAVGVSPTGGMCVSSPLEQRVQKLFFAVVRLPFKVTRLEEVRVKVIVYNHHTYPVMAHVAVQGSEDLCFSANQDMHEGQNKTHFSMSIAEQSAKLQVIKVIPLRSGNPTLTVHVKNDFEEDVVQKVMRVGAEGQRMRKTLTFVLDPEARHATFGRTRKRMNTLINTRSITSTVSNNNRQRTKINLAMPHEYIRGTESSSISAFGDIMGDVINNGVVKSKSLMDLTLTDAEEVIGDMGPIVHVLLYANQTGLLDNRLRCKGQKFISHAIVRLLHYRIDSAFHLTSKSPKATWLTAIALKTLCHATHLAFVDKDAIITMGFNWLMQQVSEDGSLLESDWRLAKDSLEYKLMLSAEVLIATLECDQFDSENLIILQAEMVDFLINNLESVSDPLVLAKVAYALTLSDPEEKSTLQAVKMLNNIKRKNNKGHVYWSSEEVTNEKRKIPFWYLKGAKASAIEATSFALLVYLHRDGDNIDAITDWLVTQRNRHGVFVGALDSMAAIQALSVYSAKKHGIKVNLSCRLRGIKTKDFSHSFTFTEKDAIHPKSLSNVPVGDIIDVITKGQGLGQMQVNVEYNIPIDRNIACRYNISIQVKHTEVKYAPELTSYPLCMYCDVDCPGTEPEAPPTTEGPDLGSLFPNLTLNATQADNMTAFLNLTFLEEEESANETKLLILPPFDPNNTLNLGKRDKIVSMEKGPDLSSTEEAPTMTFSRESLCIQVCIDYLDDLPGVAADIEVEMLTGYEPILSDVYKLENKPGIQAALYDAEKEALILRFLPLPNQEKVCFTFRAMRVQDVRKSTPAILSVTEIGSPVPSCVMEYHAPRGRSLYLFCSNPSNINRGECKCFSGLCSRCKPRVRNELSIYDVKQLVCNADIGYQIKIDAERERDAQWIEYRAKILSLNKTSSNHSPKSSIIMMSPSACPCPSMFAIRGKPMYVLSSKVQQMVNNAGNNIYRYLLDEKSVFLSVAPPSGTNSSYHQLPFFAMQSAFNSQQQCRKG